jgi:DNA polymerase III, epsilon subunit and related 3''-5'' exonucleases
MAKAKRAPLREPGPTFVAIDFETATARPESACAVGLVRVEGGRIGARVSRLIRPPRNAFTFTAVHGIAWRDVADAPVFHDVWVELAPQLEGAAFLAAHNAQFDERVLHACCRTARLEPPDIPFRCTLQLVRKLLPGQPASLPAVCRKLGISLCHHDPVSDAEACARLVIAASRKQFRIAT